ncbi:MAG: PKD domain-containing protein [Bacteroidota bacterium]
MLIGLLSGAMQMLAQPVAEFTATPIEGCAPLVVSFTDLSTNAVAWRWETGVGPSTLRNPGKFYTTPGSYTVRLIVFDASGQSDTIIKPNFIVVHGNPEADLQGDATDICANEVVHFSDISNPVSGQNAQWAWDFGDGNTSTNENPLHRYATKGIYPVSLMVTN